MERIKEISNELDELRYKLSCGISLIDMIQTAGEQGENAPGQSYYDAIFGAYDYLNGIKQKIDAALDDLQVACE